MNGAPDWQDGECCFRCRTQFTLVARKHHCRNCGNIFCAKCSSQQIPISRLNIDKAVRVCDGCYEKISSKSADPLTMALGSEDKEQQVRSKSSSSKSSSSSNNKSSANASAPSEQELKEEEELQLALALSLSEAPTKVSFPDCRQFEEPVTSTVTNSIPTTNATPILAAPVASISSFQPTTTTAVEPQQTNFNLTPEKSIPQQQDQKQQPVQVQAQPSFEYYLQDRDREAFHYVAEIQSTLEIFNNRLNACKLRNRPIANDSAIQSLFLKLNTEFQPKLTEYMKSYEEERAGYERLQDKLSQISDARAALDDLREEHQEKMRLLAAEAEKQRQSQLATKLEAMRQKKSQMMQYQRELALQRIREQEMMLQQPQQQHQVAHGYQPSTVSNQPQQTALPDPAMAQMSQSQGYSAPTQAIVHSHSGYANHTPATSYQPQASSYQNQQIASHDYPNSATQHSSYTPSQQSYQQAPDQPQVFQNFAPQAGPDYTALAKFEQQYLPKPPKPDEDTPLISFDE